MIKKERLVNADVIRVVAMMMVVVFHTILSFTVREDFFFTKLYFLFEPIIVISRVAVLIFFMLSGYLVVNKDRSVLINLKKTFNKIILPLSFFTIINIYLDWIKFSNDKLNPAIFIEEQMARMSQSISSPMWFLVVLTYLYLLNPLWVRLFNNSQKVKFSKYLIGFFLLLSIVATIFDFFLIKSRDIFTSQTYWLGFVFFYLYGAMVKKKWLTINHQIINLIIFSIGFITSMLGNVAYGYMKVNSLPVVGLSYFESYLSIPVIMMAVAIFNILISINVEMLRSKLLLWLSSLSFGVYLVHTYILRFFIDYLGFTFDNLRINVYLFNLINLFLIFTISIIITSIWRKIPRIKAFIGG